MKQLTPARITSLAALCALALTGCSGGGDATTGAIKTGGDFLVLSTEPINNGQLFLNEPIRIDFSSNVDLSSADLNTVSFQVLDQNGNPLAEQPTGRFALDRSPADTAVGRRLLFIPRFPTNNTYDNGGFRPGRTYLVQLIGGDRINQTVLRATNGKALAVPLTFRFATADGTTPAQLFRDTRAGGPTRVDFQITPAPDAQGVVLNKFGAPPVELRLVFNQPLNPNANNVPLALDTNPLLRSINQRGRIYLEYDDVDPNRGTNTWIPADVELEVNDLDRSVVVLRPVGVLPNNATVRVIVENTLEDISGESNVANAAYSRVFGTFRTRSAYEPQFDAVVENFIDANLIDFNAAFLEPQARYDRGSITAGFEFEGTPTTLEYEPTASEVVLNTDFTQVVPKNGPPFNVSGGVFNFRNVTIPAGVIVNGLGTRPMVWLVSNDFKVAGLLSVRGGDGDRVNVLNSANFPTAGGVGVCSGGNGGRGSPNSTGRSLTGEAGFGPGQVPGGGGRAGQLSCVAGCGRGSGGGGGALSTQGDPWYKQQAGAGTTFQQQRGVGGNGCGGAAGAASRNLAGGISGPVAFTDSRSDNNFWGVGINVQRQLRIAGELLAPIGGQGGGGGGDLSNSGGCNPTDPNFISDSKGGGGGGGGGVLIVKALRDIVVEPSGRITADGGHGGGGEQAGSCNQGGGGGSGSGGMVILMAGRQIVLHAKGVASASRYTYAQNDYDSVISAEGGVCLTGTFGSPVVSAKYPASGQTPMAGTAYDGAPLGALGGMGIVQLMAPPGDPASPGYNSDGTNTGLDDNIVFFRNGVQQTGAAKRDLLAWRGFPNAQGVLVDDFNTPINIGSNEGDIRPTPTLLPVPFSTRTRLRSKWIDAGAALRRPLTSPDGNPRGIVEDTVNGFLAGPTYEFAGTTNNSASLSHGFAAYAQTGGQAVQLSYPQVADGTILKLDSNVSHLGQTAYRVEITQPQFGAVVDRYLGYEAELVNAAGTVLASFRILAHTDRTVTLAPEGKVLPANPASVVIRAKFFQIMTNGAEGLGATYIGISNNPVPQSNVRIGFAFHRNPAGGVAGDRFPVDPNQWVFNLNDPAVQEQIRSRGMGYVMWDVLFDSAFRSTTGDVPPGLSPSSQRPTLNYLRLPFRF